MEIVDLSEKTGFSDTFMPRILKVATDYKVPLICMEPGQSIAPHPSGKGVFYIVSGKGIMTVDGEEVEVEAGKMIFVEKDASRGIRATTERLVAFAVHMG